MVDSVELPDDSTANKARAGVCEYLENDLHKIHLTEKRTFTLNQIKTCARQLLVGLCEVHQKNIIHTGPYFVKLRKKTD